MCMGGAVPRGSSVSTCANRPSVWAPPALTQTRPVFHQTVLSPVLASRLYGADVAMVATGAPFVSLALPLCSASGDRTGSPAARLLRLSYRSLEGPYWPSWAAFMGPLVATSDSWSGRPMASAKRP